MTIGYYRILGHLYIGKGMLNDYWVVWVFGRKKSILE